MKINVKLAVLLIILSCSTVFSQGQPKKKRKVKEHLYSIQLRYQLGNSFLHNPLVIFDNCVGCIRTDQGPVKIHDFDITFFRKLNKLNSIAAIIGYSGYGFQNDHFTSVPQPMLFEDYTMRFYFFSLGAGHLLKLRILPFLDLNFGNSILLDLNSPPDDYLIKKANLSYKGSMEMEFFPGRKVSLLTGLFLKHSITNYNKIRFNKDYYPYNYGVLLGMKFNFG